MHCDCKDHPLSKLIFRALKESKLSEEEFVMLIGYGNTQTGLVKLDQWLRNGDGSTFLIEGVLARFPEFRAEYERFRDARFASYLESRARDEARWRQENEALARKNFTPLLYAVTDLDSPGQRYTVARSARQIAFSGPVALEEVRAALRAFLEQTSGDLGSWGAVIGFHFRDKYDHYYVLDIEGNVLGECNEVYSPRVGLTYRRNSDLTETPSETPPNKRTLWIEDLDATQDGTPLRGILYRWSATHIETQLTSPFSGSILPEYMHGFSGQGYPDRLNGIVGRQRAQVRLEKMYRAGREYYSLLTDEEALADEQRRQATSARLAELRTALNLSVEGIEERPAGVEKNILELRHKKRIWLEDVVIKVDKSVLQGTAFHYSRFDMDVVIREPIAWLITGVRVPEGARDLYPDGFGGEYGEKLAKFLLAKLFLENRHNYFFPTKHKLAEVEARRAKEIGARLARYQAEHNLTLEELAMKRLALPRHRRINMTRGLLAGTKAIDEGIAKALSDLLGETPDYWFGLELSFWGDQLPAGTPPWRWGSRLTRRSRTRPVPLS